MTTDSKEFIKFHEALVQDRPEYKPWYFMLNKGEKDPLEGQGWKADKHQLSYDAAIKALEMGYNIGIAGTDKDGLVIIDVDDKKAFKDHIFIKTLTAKSSSRVGTHYYYFTLDPNAKINIPLEHAGELRTNWQYVVAPGSYAKLSDSKDDSGNITKTSDEKLMELPDDEKELSGKYTLEDIMPPSLITYSDIPQIFKDEKEKREVKEKAKLNKPRSEFNKNSDSNNSALFELTIDDVITSIPDRGRHPSLFHDSHTGKNTSISDELLHCWRHNVTHNAISALSVMAGIYNCVDAGDGHKNSGSGSSCIDYDDGESIFKIWTYAKENGYISKNDSIPSKAITWLALKNNMCNKSDLIDGWKLPNDVYIKFMEILSPKVDNKITDTPIKNTKKKTIRDKLNELTISEDQLDNVTSAINFVKNSLNGSLMPFNVTFIETYLKPYFSFSSKTTSEIISEMKTYFKEKKIQEEMEEQEKKKRDEIKNKEQTDKLPDKILNSAREIMYTGDPVQKIIDTHAKMHVGDEPLARALLVSIGIQSVRNSDGIHPKVSGDSGKGKTHCCKAMMHLLPKKYKFSTTLSDKAIYYMDIPEGAVIFSDDVDLSDSLQGIIKRATSNFQEGDTYTTIDINRAKQELKIPPRVSWWLTSVDDDQSLQLLNRQFGGGVDESGGQDKAVFEFQKKLLLSGEVGLPENEDVQICRCIIDDIKQQLYTVIVPFADDLLWEDIDNRRNFLIFADIIRAFAVLRHRQRYHTKNNEIIANIEDFNDAKNLYIGRARNQGTKLTDVELKFCNLLNGSGEMDYNVLQKAMGVSQGRISQIIHGKGKGDSGLINKVRGLIVEKQSVKTDDETTVQKKVCSLHNFNPFDHYKTIITLKEGAEDRFLAHYPPITRILPDKNALPSYYITNITYYNKNISNILINDSVCDGIVKNICPSVLPEKQGNKVINPRPISKEQGNMSENERVILPKLPHNAQLKLTSDLVKFKKANIPTYVNFVDADQFTRDFCDAHEQVWKPHASHVKEEVNNLNNLGWRVVVV